MPEHEALAHVPLIAVLPFALTLIGIAVLPLAMPHRWERHSTKAIFAAVLGAPIAIWLIATEPESLLRTSHEYISFIALLGSLFVVAGGIHLAGDLEGTPRINVAILAAGAVLASILGTTGASMLLIRPILRTNHQRRNVAHIPFFFILIVSNCGGLLTPLGDPPLFLGYLRGVPFIWTLRLWPIWLAAVIYLLVFFFIIDTRAHRREPEKAIARDVAERTPLRVTGLSNIPLLAGVVASVFLPSPWREIAMFGLAAVSIFAAPKKPREDNRFTFEPILEVAILFAGIFVTMVPALQLLELRGGELGLTRPWHFFLTTGALSSVLDNAPTYLTLLSTAQALPLPHQVVGISDIFLTAISAGAVLMGANTYIGNGPNFMVKAIADSAGYATPSFFRYAAAAVAVLAPLYLAVAFYVSYLAY